MIGNIDLSESFRISSAKMTQEYFPLMRRKGKRNSQIVEAILNLSLN
jgi:hypothetical protein